MKLTQLSLPFLAALALSCAFTACHRHDPGIVYQKTNVYDSVEDPAFLPPKTQEAEDTSSSENTEASRVPEPVKFFRTSQE
ncbi:MAG: hypothetical protein ACFCU3_01225 [Verrucomicrobiales bacterium]